MGPINHKGSYKWKKEAEEWEPERWHKDPEVGRRTPAKGLVTVTVTETHNYNMLQKVKWKSYKQQGTMGAEERWGGGRGPKKVQGRLPGGGDTWAGPSHLLRNQLGQEAEGRKRDSPERARKAEAKRHEVIWCRSKPVEFSKAGA